MAKFVDFGLRGREPGLLYYMCMYCIGNDMKSQKVDGGKKMLLV